MGRFKTQNGSKNGSQMHFSKSDPAPFGKLKQVVLAHFEPVVTRFGPWKTPECLANGPLWDQKWVKNGSKTHYSKSGPFWDQKWVDVFRSFCTCVDAFWPMENPKMHCKWAALGPKMGRQFGMHKQVFLAHLAPVLTRFGPWKMPKCIANGPFWDQKWVENGSKTHYSKSDHAPFGMLKQMFLAHFELVVTRFGPWKMPLGLEHGPSWDQQWVKKWSKTHVTKNDPAPFGKLKHVFLAHFEPTVTRFAPWKIPKCIANGPLWDQKWVKNRSKTHFSTSDPTPFGMHQQVVLAHFAPVLTRFGPWKMPKCLENGPF